MFDLHSIIFTRRESSKRIRSNDVPQPVDLDFLILFFLRTNTTGVTGYYLLSDRLLQ